MGPSGQSPSGFLWVQKLDDHTHTRLRTTRILAVPSEAEAGLSEHGALEGLQIRVPEIHSPAIFH